MNERGRLELQRVQLILILHSLSDLSLFIFS